MRIKRIGCTIMVFLTGGVTFLHLSAIRFGVPDGGPTGYGNWHDVALAILFAVFFGAGAIKK